MSKSLADIIKEEKASARNQSRLHQQRKRHDWHPNRSPRHRRRGPHYQHHHYHHRSPHPHPHQQQHHAQTNGLPDARGVTPKFPIETLMICGPDTTINDGDAPANNICNEHAPLATARLKQLSVKQIQSQLDTQRLRNEELMAKFHQDEKKFMRVLKHYGKKNDILQKNITNHSKNKDEAVQSAQTMKALLKERQTVMTLSEQESFQHQMLKSALWQNAATNMQILAEIDSLKHQVSALERENAQILRQQKNASMKEEEEDEKNGIEVEQQKQMDKMQKIKKIQKIANINTKCKEKKKKRKRQVIIVHDDDSKEEEESATASDNGHRIIPQNNMKNKADHAKELIERNSHYQEILTQLRAEVDALRNMRVLRV